MKIFTWVWLFLILSGGLALAGAPEEEIVAQPGEVVVQVKGVVCSFCAYGTEKNLSKLEFLDKSRFGKNGVLMDIHTNRVTLALEPENPPDFPAIYQAIKKGGYDPIRVYLRLSGTVEEREGRFYLRSEEWGRDFELTGEGLENLVPGQKAEIQAHLDAEALASLPEKGPLKVVVSNVAVAQ